MLCPAHALAHLGDEGGGTRHVVDLGDLRDNRGYGATIDSAHPGGYSQAALGAARNPATLAAAGALNAIPIQC